MKSNRSIEGEITTASTSNVVEIEDSEMLDGEAGAEEDLEAEVELDGKGRPIKPGIIYLGTVPYFGTVKKIRSLLGSYGEIGRIYLQPEVHTNAAGKKEKHFTEGWVEFKDRRVAKHVAASLNSQQVGGKKRSKAFESLWNMKYLHRFKWVHLTEQLRYEKALHSQKMRAEVSAAKRDAAFFMDNLDKGKHLKQLEEQVLKKGGKWEQYQRQIQQKSVLNHAENPKDADKLLGMVLGEQE